MSSYFFDKEAKRMLNDAVSALQVVDYLGIPSKRIGSRVSILCPSPDHQDKNYGSCSIDSRGNCYCYVCRKRFSSVNLMMNLGGYSLYEALSELAHIAGCEDEYIARDVPKEDPIWLTKEERAFLGLSPEKSNYRVIGSSDTKPKDGQHYLARGDEYLLVEYVAGKDPLRELLENDPEIYRQLIIDKMKEKKETLDMIAARYGKEDESVRNEYMEQIGILKKMAERFQGEKC